MCNIYEKQLSFYMPYFYFLSNTKTLFLPFKHIFFMCYNIYMSFLRKNKESTPIEKSGDGDKGELQKHYKILHQQNLSELVKLAGCTTLSEEIQAALVLFDDSQITIKLSENPNISLQTQADITSTNNFIVKMNLAKRLDLDQKIQDILMQSGDSSVLGILAKNSNLSRDTQLKIIETKASDIIAILARNNTITEEIQLILFNQNSPEINVALALNKNLSLNVMLELFLLKNDKVTNALNAYHHDQYQKIYRLNQEILAKNNMQFVSLSKNSTKHNVVKKLLMSELS